MSVGDRQLALLAEWIDEAAQAETSFAAQQSFTKFIPISEHQGALDPEDPQSSARKATAWAFAYHVRIMESEGKWRVQVVPYFEGPDGLSFPPRVSDVPAAGVEVWANLCGKVSSHFGKARLHHLLFERKSGNVRSHAIQASRSYLQLSHEWTEWLDKEESLNVSLRLARAVGDGDLAVCVMTEMLATAKQVIAGQEEAPGVVLGLLRPLVGERTAPDGLDALLEAALRAYESPFIKDELISLKLGRSGGPEERSHLHARRVQVWLDAADAATGLAKAGHRKKALQCAQDSANSDLIDRAASALQRIREEDLGLVSFTASSAISRGKFQQLMAPVTDAADWREALMQFTFAYGPAVGTVEHTKKAAEDFLKNSLVAQLATTEHLGADGLPRFTPQSDEDVMEMHLARQESFALQSTSPLLAHALHKVAEVHGTPSETDLIEFFSQGPLMTPDLAASIARCFVRYWAGDPEGAAFSVVPKIETLIRNLVLSLDAGVYRLQRNEKPGQYPGLKSLLAILRDKGLDEAWYRNILTICGNPAGGWNLRNDLSHGFIDNVGSPGAAILFQCVLYLWALGPKQKDNGADIEV